MNFISQEFLLFFPLVLVLHRLLPPRWRWVLLLSASYLFYMGHTPWTALVLLGTTALTYAAARGMERAAPGARRGWLILALAGCLGCLVVFKYLGFLVRTAAGLVGAPDPALELLLPVGISFFTFQTLSYVIDVYRGKLPAQRHFGYYALFVSFFPQLVAGPIERPERLLPQLRRARDPGPDDIWLGLQYLLRGFCKKLVLADFCAPFVEEVYAHPAAASGPAVAGATVLFAIQIYCDFSGYSDIAVGSARLLGVELTQNFDRPYLALSIRDFWRRWHISLTSWFTDYLYIPLGGNRRGVGRQCVNTLLVFLASGLWHGAEWSFVVWGGAHGLLLILETLLRTPVPQTAAGRALARGCTFLLVCLAWVFFRAQSMADALALLAALPHGWGNGLELGLSRLDWAQLGLGLAVLWQLDRLPVQRAGVQAAALTLFSLTAAAALAWLSLLSFGTPSAFIYFQF